MVRSTLKTTYNLRNEADINDWYTKYTLWCQYAKQWRSDTHVLGLLLRQNWNDRMTVECHRENMYDLNCGNFQDFEYMSPDVEVALVTAHPHLTPDLNIVECRRTTPSANPYEPCLWVDYDINNLLEAPIETEGTPITQAPIKNVYQSLRETGKSRVYSTSAAASGKAQKTQLIFLGALEACLKGESDIDLMKSGYYAVAKMHEEKMACLTKHGFCDRSWRQPASTDQG
jgi:hypothetical protein